jgi:hypothetical protein
MWSFAALFEILGRVGVAAAAVTAIVITYADALFVSTS